jgi:hypothetical protein
MQCCPAVTWSGRTDDAGNEVPDCDCDDDCVCLCRDCRCPVSGWGEDDDWLGTATRAGSAPAWHMTKDLSH